MNRGLEPSPETWAHWLDQATEVLVRQLEGLESAPAGPRPTPDVSVAFTEEGHPLGVLLEHFEQALDASLHTAGPGYLAYVPGGGLPSAGIAQLLAAVSNRFTGLTATAPALARLEQDVIDWLIAMVGYSEDAKGVLTSGGSLANLGALITARHHATGDRGDYREARICVGRDTHHSVAKAARLAGIPAANVIEVALDPRRRIDRIALAEAVERHRPFLVVASAGTTNIGAIDPLLDIAALCAEHGIWFHVDAAYGGAWLLTQTGRDRMRGIALADSITLDPHKGFFLPYGTGCLLVRDGARLRAAFASEAGYLRDLDPDATDPAALGPELSRPYRGLTFWLPLALHGIAAFRDALDEKLALARWLAASLTEVGLEVVDTPQLSTVAFRPPRRDEETVEAWNQRTQDLLDRILAANQVWLSSTILDGVLTIRACIVSFRTHRRHVARLIEQLDT